MFGDEDFFFRSGPFHQAGSAAFGIAHIHNCGHYPMVARNSELVCYRMVQEKDYLWSEADPATTTIRLISARKPTQNEIRHYQEGL